ncbi:MAG: divergent polysaccharide deacetylase family protein [Candidatus Omnitrophica bacterium]|nr:divergent polysaccharide deacetylase family protein [Candidatus Omnitrophota bacterium]
MSSRENNNVIVLATIGIAVLVAALFIRGCVLHKKVPSAKVRGASSHEVKRPPKGVPRPTQAPVPAQKLPAEINGHIAIILDDWGYNQAHCRYLQDISAPLGVAILPGLPYSRDIIACAKAAGKDPMLHLPLEPYSAREYYAKDYLLLVSMPAPVLQKTLRRILDEMSGVVGVNNHTGSKGTESLALMNTVLGELKKRNLFFVDSVTTQRSVCLQAAQAQKMKIGRRDVFLDNRNERAYIEHQFAQAVRIARKRGYALMIGHDRDLTLKIIKEETEKFSQQGIEFLPVREYIKQYEYSGN